METYRTVGLPYLVFDLADSEANNVFIQQCVYPGTRRERAIAVQLCYMNLLCPPAWFLTLASLTGSRCQD